MASALADDFVLGEQLADTLNGRETTVTVNVDTSVIAAAPMRCLA